VQDNKSITIKKNEKREGKEGNLQKLTGWPYKGQISHNWKSKTGGFSTASYEG
jgi:hypothetical protein